MKNTFRRIIGNDKGKELKSEQVEIIKSILKGKDSISILPTGFGKSICYLVPALMLEGVTLVVTPLASFRKAKEKEYSRHVFFRLYRFRYIKK